MNLLALLIIVFLSPLLLILLAKRGGQWLHWLADYLKESHFFRVLESLSHIGIVIAVIVFVLDWPVRQETLTAFREETKVRQETLKALKEEAEERKVGAEGRAWSLIYQARGSTGDGGRRYALEYLNGKKANLSSLPLAKAYLVKIKLPKANLSGADLSGANLFLADLFSATLSRADLSRADLGGANLSRADLRGADLGGANLDGADLREASLHWADLSGADLGGGRLLRLFSWIDIREKVTQEQIDSAFFCEGNPPQLPAELKLPPVRKCDKYGKPIKE